MCCLPRATPMVLGPVPKMIRHLGNASTNPSKNSCTESITSVSCGRVSSEHFDDICICTYTGWVFAYSRMPEGSMTSGEAPAVHAVSTKMVTLKREVEELETRVMEERNKYIEMMRKDSSGNTMSYVPYFQVHDSFELNKESGCYYLGVQLVLPIEFVVLISQLEIKLVDVERNSAVVAYTKSNNDDYATVVTYRCQSAQTRVEICMRVNEGTPGSIAMLVFPHIMPPVAQIRRFDLKPLCLHVRIHYFDSSRPLNTLAVTGTFSMGESHAWLVSCFESIPAKAPQGDSVTYIFQCIADGGSMVEAVAGRGSLQFRSDSVHTIAVLRDLVTRETTHRNVRVSFSCNVEPRSIPHSLKLLHPKWSLLHDTHIKCRMALALKELEAAESELSFLSDEYKAILRDHDRLVAATEADPIEESPLLDVYNNLLLSKWRLDGANATAFLPALRDLMIKHYTLANVSEFFNGPDAYIDKRKKEAEEGGYAALL